MSNAPDYSRRVFLRALGLGAAGLAVGGAAAWAEGQLTERAALESAVGTLQTQLGTAQTGQAALNGTVTALQGQVTTLDTQLGAAQTQNAQLADALTQAQRRLEALQTELAQTQTQLTDAQTRLSQHQTLLGLYDQLESLGLDELTQTGLQSAAAGLASVLGIAPLVRGGLETARRLLAEFEQVLPDFQAGFSWLGDQVIHLKLDLYALEKAAQPFVSAAAAGTVAAFGLFVQAVLNALPFDIGAKTRAAFAAAQTLITQTNDLAGAADERVFGKLARYVSGGARSWQQQFVPPLREATLAPTEQFVTAVDGAQQTFQTALYTPVQATLTQRASLRQQIAAYRTDHQL